MESSVLISDFIVFQDISQFCYGQYMIANMKMKIFMQTLALSKQSLTNRF